MSSVRIIRVSMVLRIIRYARIVNRSVRTVTAKNNNIAYFSVIQEWYTYD